MARGDGSGGWVTESGIVDPADYTSAQFMFSPGDFSGDGIPDVMYRIASGVVYLRRGTASGGLESSPVPVLTGLTTATAMFSAGDFNGDGDADIFWRRSDGALFAVWGNGAGGWLTGTYVQVGTGWNAANLFAGGDFSGDGKGDVVRRNVADNSLYLYKGNGAGGFLNATSPDLVGTGWSAYQAIFVVPDFRRGRTQPSAMPPPICAGASPTPGWSGAAGRPTSC
jgi:hypothetical protein